MLEDYDNDAHETGSNRIFSGETELLKQVQSEWYRLYEADEGTQEEDIPQRWSYEQVLEEPKIFLDAVKQIKNIPAYRYVINYLLLKTGLKVEKSVQRDFADFIAERKFYDASQVSDKSDVQELWQVLSFRLDSLYSQNGYRGNMDWIGFFSELVESFSYDFLKRLALGVHMPLEDFEIFLTKVLKRSNINFYDRDEIFVYLTLKYADSCGYGAYYQAYERLCELYPIKEDIIEPPWPGWKDHLSTGRLRNELQARVSRIGSSVFEETNAELEDYLAYVAWLQSSKISRTAKERFHILWNGLKERWEESGELTEIIRSEREKRKNAEGTDVFCRELTVVYDSTEECVLPAGTEFMAKTLKASIKGDNTAIFRLPQEQVLPAVSTKSVEVKVRALMPEAEFTSAKEILSAKKVLQIFGKRVPQFMKEAYFEKLEKKNLSIREGNQKKKKRKPEIAFSRMKACAKKMEKDIEDIKIQSGLLFSENSDKKNVGILQVECKKGTNFPKGTQFYFKLEEVEFRYESLEDVNAGAPDLPEPLPQECGRKQLTAIKVKAVWENAKEFQQEVTDGQCTFLPANTKFTHNLEHVYEVYTKQAVTLKSAAAKGGQKEDYKVSDSLLFRQIYDTGEEKHADSLGYYQGFPEYGEDYFLNSDLFRNTRIIRSHISSLPADEERIRNLILTLKFLEYVWWNEEYDDYDADGVQYVMEDFLKDNGTDAELTACGFYAFSVAFPYDAFLKLLLNSDDPLALFQAVWSDKPLLREEK